MSLSLSFDVTLSSSFTCSSFRHRFTAQYWINWIDQFHNVRVCWFVHRIQIEMCNFHSEIATLFVFQHFCTLFNFLENLNAIFMQRFESCMRHLFGRIFNVDKTIIDYSGFGLNTWMMPITSCTFNAFCIDSRFSVKIFNFPLKFPFFPSHSILIHFPHITIVNIWSDENSQSGKITFTKKKEKNEEGKNDIAILEIVLLFAQR